MAKVSFTQDIQAPREMSGLPVRSIAPLDGSTPKGSLTHKGPQQEGRFKRREELNFEVADTATHNSRIQR